MIDITRLACEHPKRGLSKAARAIALDKWYGNMYGIEVDIWADNREIRSVQEAWSMMPPPEESATANTSSPSPDSTPTPTPFPTTSPSSTPLTVASEFPSIIILPIVFAATLGGGLFWRQKSMKGSEA